MSAPAPLAAGDEFAAAVDALAEVASYANLAHVIAPNDDRAPSEWAAARANVLRLYAAAEARGRAAALAEVDAACDELADLDEFEAVALWRIAPDRWRAEVTASAESTAVGIGLTATGAILDLADCASAVVP